MSAGIRLHHAGCGTSGVSTTGEVAFLELESSQVCNRNPNGPHLMNKLEKWEERLCGLSLDRDYWLTVGDPEDIVYMHIEQNLELRDFYDQTLGYPIKDELRVAKKIRQLNFCMEENGATKSVLKDMVNVKEWEHQNISR